MPEHAFDRPTSGSAGIGDRRFPTLGNGVLVSKSTSHGRTHYVYLMRQPMATELIQLAVGGYQAIDRGRHNGLPIRDVIAPSLSTMPADKLPNETSHIDWMEHRVGDYPFDIYGSLVVDQLLGFALETQSLSLYDRAWFDGSFGGIGVWEPTMVHELAHMWFGDSVSPYEWSDVWLNEGHARWYQFLFAAENGQPEENTGIADFTDLMQIVYFLGDQCRAEDGPVGDDGRLHRPGLAGLSPGPARVPALVAVRHQDAADARAPGLGGRPGPGRRAGAVARRHAAAEVRGEAPARQARQRSCPSGLYRGGAVDSRTISSTGSTTLRGASPASSSCRSW